MKLTCLKVGDVIRQDGLEYVVDMVNECRARLRPLARVLSGDRISISPNTEPGLILRRLSKTEMDTLLAPKRPGVVEEADGQNNETTATPNDCMKNQTEKKERKPIAGRSAFIHKQKSAGVSKKEAFEKVVAKGFDCSQAAFDKIWDAEPRGQGKAKKEASKPAAKSAKAAPKAPPAKKPATKKAKASVPPPPAAKPMPSAPPPPVETPAAPAESPEPAAT